MHSIEANTMENYIPWKMASCKKQENKKCIYYPKWVIRQYIILNMNIKDETLFYIIVFWI